MCFLLFASPIRRGAYGGDLTTFSLFLLIGDGPLRGPK